MINMKQTSKDRIEFDRYIANTKGWKGENFFTVEYMQGQIHESMNKLTSTYRKRLADTVGILSDSENAINTDLKLRRSFYTQISFRADEIMDYAIYSRYINGNVEDLLNGIFTYGRLSYLGNIVKPFSYSGTDCIHSRDILISAAGYDLPMLQAYLRAIPGPPQKGHLLLKSLETGLYALISEEAQIKKEAVVILTKAKETKVLGKWDKAVLSCIIAIITLNREAFSISLHDVLNLHARSSFTRGLLEHISFPAHTLYNFAYFAFEKGGLPLPEEPVHKYWDSELWNLVKTSGQKREYIIDIKKESPVLAQWMDELPTILDFNLLMHSLDRS